MTHGRCVRSDACAAIVGDITPNCGISKQKKAELEADAIRDIQKMLGANTAVGMIDLHCPCRNSSLQCPYYAAHSDISRHGNACGYPGRTSSVL